MYFVHRLCLHLVIIALLTTLLACSVPFSPLPSNVVMLTPAYPTINGRCTGVVVDATHVLTAAHCIHSARRVVTPWGQEAWIVSYSARPAQDLALIEVDRMLVVERYADFARAALNTPGYIYGTCPYYWGHQARLVFYGGLVTSVTPDRKFELDYDMWFASARYGNENKVCGGDSGGVVMQNGKVTGVMSAIDSDTQLWAIGSTLYAIPSDAIQGLLHDELKTAVDPED